MKLFRSSSADQATITPVATRLARRSSGLLEVTKLLGLEDPLCVLDLGFTSATNIRYFTERGHKIYSEDLIEASADPSLAAVDEQGNPTLDSKRFLAENLTYPNAHFDVALCWNLADYLDESLVKPVVGRLWSVLKPGGALLAFFHTREAGPDALCYRYHIVSNDTLEMQPLESRRGRNAINPRLQRVFNNRHIENLFRDFSSIKFFLGRDNIREVLVIR
jgi:SAM-dependent methyltransferase